MNDACRQWIEDHPRTVMYVIVITTLNFLLNIFEVLIK